MRYREASAKISFQMKKENDYYDKHKRKFRGIKN